MTRRLRLFPTDMHRQTSAFLCCTCCVVSASALFGAAAVAAIPASMTHAPDANEGARAALPKIEDGKRELERGHPERAIKLFWEAYRNWPSTELDYRFAEAYLQLKNCDDARKHIELFVKSADDDAKIKYGMPMRQK